MDQLGSVVVALALVACSTTTPASSDPAVSASARLDETPRASASNSPDLSWELLDPAPVERIEMATVAHDGAIWLMGGLNADGSASDETWRFDPAFGDWSAGPSLPAPVHHAAAVSTGDALYVIGGYDGSSFDMPRTTVLILNAAGGGWDEGISLPEPRAAGGAAWDGSRIIYAGGVGPEIVSDVMALADAGWVQLGAMGAPREHLSATSDGEGRVWLMGGRAGSLDTNSGAVDLVEGNLVSRIGNLPTARGGAAAFFLPQFGACLAGGEQPDRALDAVECVDADGSLTTLPPLAVGVHGHGAAVMGDAAHVVLGGPQPLLTVGDTIQRLGTP